MPNARKKSANRQQPTDPTAGLPPLHLNAAGLDVGSAEHDGAVPPDRSPEPVRRLASLTAELHALADWRQACRIETVVMESTGVDWIALCQILEARGFAVHLINAPHAKSLPGRQTDIADCQGGKHCIPSVCSTAPFVPPMRSACCGPPYASAPPSAAPRPPASSPCNRPAPQ